MNFGSPMTCRAERSWSTLPIGLLVLSMVMAMLVAVPAFGSDANLPTTTVGEHPEVQAGNDTSCPGDSDQRFKIDGTEDSDPGDEDLNSGTYTDPATGATFTLTIPSENPPSADAPGPSLDFAIDGGTANVVIVKGGPDHNEYNYANDPGDGQQDGETFVGAVSADTYLHSPPRGKGFFGLSHITFCYDIVGLLKVQKFIDVDQDGELDGGDVTGGDSNLNDWEFEVYDSGGTLVATLNTGTDNDGMTDTVELDAGDYTIVETNSGKTIETSVTGGSTTFVTTDDPATATVVAGETATAQFGNACLITKNFAIAGAEGQDVLAIYDKDNDGQVTGTDVVTVALTEESGVHKGTAPEEFKIGDAIEWTFGVDTDGDGVIDFFDDADPTWEEFTVANGGYRACAVLNEGELEAPEIVVTKFKDADDDGDVSDAHDPLEGWEIILKDEGGNLITSEFTDGLGQVTFDDLEIGATYTVCETTQTNWVQTYPTDCHDVGPLGVGASESVEFHNSPLSDIKVGFTDLTGFTDVTITCTDADGNVVYSRDTSSEAPEEDFTDVIEDYRLRQGDLTCVFEVVDP